MRLLTCILHHSELTSLPTKESDDYMSVSIVKVNNTWLFTCKYLDPISKEYKRATRRGFKTKNEAILAEAKFIEKMESAPVQEISFQEMFYKYMSWRKHEIKPTTYKNWIQRFEKHVIPSLGHIPMTQLNLKIFEDWRQEMLSKNLSDSYMNDILKPIKATLRYANDYFDMDISYIDKIKRFKSATTFKKEMTVWNLEQFRRFEKQISYSIFWHTFFNLLYFTGLRKGEAQALTWKDIDFENKTLIINKTLAEKIEGVPYQILPPKTNASYRTITLADETLSLLKSLKQTLFGQPNTFVFEYDGKHLSSSTLNRYYKIFVEQSGVPKIRIHDFRHSHASYLIGNGMNIVDVSKRLGHSDITMTLNTYIHFMPHAEDRIATFLNTQKELFS